MERSASNRSPGEFPCSWGKYRVPDDFRRNAVTQLGENLARHLVFFANSLENRTGNYHEGSGNFDSLINSEQRISARLPLARFLDRRNHQHVQ